MKISDKVRRVLDGEQISMEELQMMISQAALTSSEGGNRRYFHWMFQYDEMEDLLEDMRRFEVVQVGHGIHRQSEEHDVCEGQGCKDCGWVGEVVRMISDKPLTRHEAFRGGISTTL